MIDEVDTDPRVWAFDYKAKKENGVGYETKQITDIAQNIFVRRVKFLQYSQKPENLNYICNIGRPYCVPGQGKKSYK